MIGAAFFPLASTGDAVSTTWGSRLLARMLVALGTTAMIFMLLFGTQPARRMRRPPPRMTTGSSPAREV